MVLLCLSFTTVIKCKRIILETYKPLIGVCVQVLKVAILGEKYAQDYTWYVDVILNLIRIAGDYVSEEVWYRVVHIVVNREEVQGYAAKTAFEALLVPLPLFFYPPRLSRPC